MPLNISNPLNVVFGDDINTRIAQIDKEVTRLEHVHNLDETERNLQIVNGWIVAVEVIRRQYHYAGIFRGSSAQVLADFYIGAPDASVPGVYVDWEWRYRQQVPSIYTSAQKAAQSNYVLLDSGRVNVTVGAYVPQHVEMLAPTTEDLRGTYGRFEIWTITNGAYLAYGERCGVNVLSTGFI